MRRKTCVWIDKWVDKEFIGWNEATTLLVIQHYCLHNGNESEILHNKTQNKHRQDNTDKHVVKITRQTHNIYITPRLL